MKKQKQRQKKSKNPKRKNLALKQKQAENYDVQSAQKGRETLSHKICQCGRAIFKRFEDGAKKGQVADQKRIISNHDGCDCSDSFDSVFSRSSRFWTYKNYQEHCQVS
jgi:ribosomal protein L32